MRPAMAQDDNAPPRLRGPPPGATEPPDHVRKPQIYEVFHGSTTPERSELANASFAGQEGQPSKSSRPTFQEGMQSIKYDDFLRIHQIPCAREGLMTGIGAGAVVGVGRFFTGAKAPKAANWAFGGFLLGSVIQWEYCQAQRRKERAAMARVVEVIDRKKAEKAEKAAQAAQAARLRREAEERAQKSWYKFW
ncbi:hypothetical protein GQX73_g9424 [Xylaria multiplex]|uniref:Cytochrome c oxidase assembly protein COX20, mitochondrial n=1 Tax=Xylaria multiplex TaxID=323545 RepID=A0A7C8II17_9PEZI|nr:hypothetical protein GQX73_g9424 [Xylaria multiplex]